MKLIISKLTSLLCLLVITTFLSCNVSEESNGSGSMVISIKNNDSRTLIPDLNMSPVKYTITGTGPLDSVFTKTVIISESSDLQFDNLSIGNWTIVVNAYNSEDICVGSDSAEVSINNNKVANCSIVIKPLEGVGSLSLSVDWVTSDFDNPVLKATLIPFEGESTVLESYDLQNIADNNTTAMFQFDNLNTGYYELKVELSQENSTTVRSFEIVRVVKDQTTTGTITIVKRNQSSISIDISSKMESPLNVTITGTVEILNLNETLTLSANTENYTEPLKYNWYVNGTAVIPEVNNELTFGENLLSGSYEISVSAFSIDGTRAGFASTVIEVKDIDLKDYSEMVLVTGHHTLNDYYIGKYELTYNIWHEVYSWAVNNGYVFQNPGREGSDGINGASPTGGSNKPVTNISWRDAVVWCNAYSEMSGKIPAYVNESDNVIRDSSDSNGSECDNAIQSGAYGYRLPSHDEWFYTAYGGQYDTDNDYEGLDNIESIAWIPQNSDDKVHDTGLKIPNELGLYDILGNVAEYSFEISSWDSSDREVYGFSYTFDSQMIYRERWNDLSTDSLGNNSLCPGIRLVCN